MKNVAVYAGYIEMLKGAGYRLAHLRREIDRLEPCGCLRVGIGCTPSLGDAECFEGPREIVFSSADTMPMKRPKRSLAANVKQELAFWRAHLAVKSR